MNLIGVIGSHATVTETEDLKIVFCLTILWGGSWRTKCVRTLSMTIRIVMSRAVTQTGRAGLSATVGCQGVIGNTSGYVCLIV